MPYTPNDLVTLFTGDLMEGTWEPCYRLNLAFAICREFRCPSFSGLCTMVYGPIPHEEISGRAIDILWAAHSEWKRKEER